MPRLKRAMPCLKGAMPRLKGAMPRLKGAILRLKIRVCLEVKLYFYRKFYKLLSMKVTVGYRSGWKEFWWYKI